MIEVGGSPLCRILTCCGSASTPGARLEWRVLLERPGKQTFIRKASFCALNELLCLFAAFDPIVSFFLSVSFELVCDAARMNKTEFALVFALNLLGTNGV